MQRNFLQHVDSGVNDIGTTRIDSVAPGTGCVTSKWTILGAVMMGVIMGPIDGSIVNVVLPAIAAHFHSDYSLAQWVPMIYLLSICSFILVYGRLGDLLGYKTIFLTGLACFAGASFLCVLYANRGQSLGWFSARGGALLLCAAVFGWLFVYRERMSAQPMIDFSIFSNRRFSFACLSSLLNFMALYTVVFLTPWYLTDALHRNFLTVGMVMTAFPLLTFFAGPLSGSLSDHIGSRGLAFFGMCIHAVGLVLLSRLDGAAGNSEVAWRLAVCGLGAGIFQSPINSAVMGSAPARFRGVASSILAVTRNIGMVFGIAVAGAVVYHLAPFTSSGHAGHFTGHRMDAYLNGLHWAYSAGALLSLCAAFSALLAKRNTDK